jgi:hypothetical protein
MLDEVWNLRIHDLFCLDCDAKMEYYGYENGSNLDENNIINSDKFETDGNESHLYKKNCIVLHS